MVKDFLLRIFLAMFSFRRFKSLIDDTLSNHDSIDIFINNAGIKDTQ